MQEKDVVVGHVQRGLLRSLRFAIETTLNKKNKKNREGEGHNANRNGSPHVPLLLSFRCANGD